MHVDRVDDPRFKLAIDLLNDGRAIVFKNVELWINRENRVIEIRILVESAHRLGEENAKGHLNRGKDTFDFLKANSKTFDAIVATLSPRFSFVFDYGTGAVEVGYLSNGNIIWN